MQRDYNSHCNKMFLIHRFGKDGGYLHLFIGWSVFINFKHGVYVILQDKVRG